MGSNHAAKRRRGWSGAPISRNRTKAVILCLSRRSLAPRCDAVVRTVDPDAEYLNAGETYTLDITAGLTSTYGVPFAGDTIEFTPKDSSPRGEPGFLVQKITQSGTSKARPVSAH